MGIVDQDDFPAFEQCGIPPVQSVVGQIENTGERVDSLGNILVVAERLDEISLSAEPCQSENGFLRRR
jgi:hypothetical protein